MPDDLDMIMVDEAAELHDQLLHLPPLPEVPVFEGHLDQPVALRALLPRRTNLKPLRSQRPIMLHPRPRPKKAGRDFAAEHPAYELVVRYGGKGERMKELHPAPYAGTCTHPNAQGLCPWLVLTTHWVMARPYTFSHKESSTDAAV